MDDVEFGSDEDLRKLSYYPANDGAPLELDYDPVTQLPGLSHEETFQLDVSGYLRLPGVLSAEEAAAVSLQPTGGGGGGGGQDPLCDHPTLRRYLTYGSPPSAARATNT